MKKDLFFNPETGDVCLALADSDWQLSVNMAHCIEPLDEGHITEGGYVGFDNPVDVEILIEAEQEVRRLENQLRVAKLRLRHFEQGFGEAFCKNDDEIFVRGVLFSMDPEDGFVTTKIVNYL
jgi:hypothetical protein